MATAELARFTAALQREPRLREEFRNLTADRGALLAWVRSQGYTLTPGELNVLIDASDELSDDELEHAAGGEDPWAPKP
jgi:predicted ribosomally synthesized peptide with nif11-like leader